MRASIKELPKKIKHFIATLPIETLYALIIVVVGFSAFGLGRLSALEEQRPTATLKYDTTLSSEPSMIIQGKVVASWKGSKYHYPWCPGATAMNEKNKRWFDSIEEARAAGYTPAGNCAGLEK